MIEKVQFVNLTGPVSDFDRVIEQYISKYEIQFEYATKELAAGAGMSPFTEKNPYTKTMDKAEKIVDGLGLSDKSDRKEMSKEFALDILERATNFFETKSSEIEALEDKKDRLAVFVQNIEPFIDLNFSIEQLALFEFITYHFGVMPLISFKQFEKFLYDEKDILFVVGKNDGENIWGLYFAPVSSGNKAAALFSSLHFEKIWIPYELDGEQLTGTLRNVYYEIKDRIFQLESDIRQLKNEKLDALDISPTDIVAAFNKIKKLHRNFDARKYAIRTIKDFYILVGWMPVSEARKLEEDVENDANIALVIEENNNAIKSRPPSKIKNLKIVKPFEFFVNMYGVPSYGELDPTPLVALTYTLIFGIMFGDAGQGIVLSLLGLFLYKAKKMQLGAIMTVIGLSSAVFGFLYGSVFGFEELIEPILLRPSENINTMLITTVAIGVFLIFVAMLFNIINAFRRRDLIGLILSQNGIAGILFYASVITVVVSVFTGKAVFMVALVPTLIITLALIAIKDPVSERLKRRRSNDPDGNHSGIVMYVVELVIELFEILLGYFTNTVSFVRVGAFALSHAGIMGAVMILARTANGGHNIIVVIIGNLLVIGLEGLVVGIQTLRLHFYEIFSRFYDGKGTKFVPFNINM